MVGFTDLLIGVFAGAGFCCFWLTGIGIFSSLFFLFSASSFIAIRSSELLFLGRRVAKDGSSARIPSGVNRHRSVHIIRRKSCFMGFT